MMNTILGELCFKFGWKGQRPVTLFGKVNTITVKASAYFEKDMMTMEQEASFCEYAENEATILNQVESILLEYVSDKSTEEQFFPKMIVFQRDGSYAILFDDAENPDDGIAVCVKPILQIMSQDEYL